MVLAAESLSRPAHATPVHWNSAARPLASARRFRRAPPSRTISRARQQSFRRAAAQRAGIWLSADRPHPRPFRTQRPELTTSTAMRLRRRRAAVREFSVADGIFVGVDIAAHDGPDASVGFLYVNILARLAQRA